MRSYKDSVHFYGRIWVATAIFLMIMAPVAICVYYDAWPELKYVLTGLLGVAPIFWTTAIIEVLTYAPCWAPAARIWVSSPATCPA